MFLAEIIRYSASQEIRGTTGERLPEQYTSVTWWVCKGIILRFFFFVFFFNPEESHYLKNKNKTKRNQTKQYKTKQNKTKNGVTTFLAVFCFPGSYFSTFSHNWFFYVCLFVSYCFVFEEREVINWMACVIPATHSINYLKFWFCWLIEGRVNQLALFLFDFKVKPCEFLRKKKNAMTLEPWKMLFQPFSNTK